jgi:hypothetical protein
VFGLPFDEDGTFYRGNIHCHSTRSDGRLSPEDLLAAYRAEGYDFVALTDHFMERYGFPVTDTSAARDDTFTTILGAELHAPAMDNGQLWHIVAVGLPADFAPRAEDEDATELAARAIAAGAFVGIAHPAWNGVKMRDVESIADAHAIEIFNTGHRADADRGDGWYMADLMTIEGRRILGYAADDAHFNGRPDHFGGWVMVRAKELSPEALLAALKDGHFYSSQGPTIEDVTVTDETITVRCSPAASIHAAGEPPLNRYVHAGDGETITEATFPIAYFGGRSCRVTVVDHEGRRAWTNPFWLEEFGPLVG